MPLWGSGRTVSEPHWTAGRTSTATSSTRTPPPARGWRCGWWRWSRAERWLERRFEHDDAVLVADQGRSGGERDAAEADLDVALTAAQLDAGARARRQRLDAEVEPGHGTHVAHAAVDHQARPAVVAGQPGQHVAHQGNPQRPAAVDHQHAAGTRLAPPPAHDHVVLVASHGA